jgi:hypothetical protein
MLAPMIAPMLAPMLAPRLAALLTPEPLAYVFRYRGTVRGWLPVGPPRPLSDAHRFHAVMARTLPAATLRVVPLP